MTHNTIIGAIALQFLNLKIYHMVTMVEILDTVEGHVYTADKWLARPDKCREELRQMIADYVQQKLQQCDYSVLREFLNQQLIVLQEYRMTAKSDNDFITGRIWEIERILKFMDDPLYYYYPISTSQIKNKQP